MIHLASLLVFAALPAHAGPGATGFDFLNIGVGARQIGMGEAAVAVADDVNAAYWNPAALGELKTKEASFLYTSYAQSISYEYLAYAQPMKGGGTIGGQLHYVDYGDIQGYDNGGAKTSTFKAGDLMGGVGYAQALGRDFVAGGTLKYLSERIENASGRAFAADLGALYRPRTLDWRSHWRLGLSYRNLGNGGKFISETERLPGNAGLGAAFKGLEDAFTASLELHLPARDSLYVNLGGEYWLNNTAALRLGYRGGRDLGNGLAMGLGLKFKGAQLDYAFSSLGEVFGNAHRVSLTFRFGGAAEDLAEEGLRHLQAGRYAEAILSFKEALDVDPDNYKALRGLKEASDELRSRRAP